MARTHFGAYANGLPLVGDSGGDGKDQVRSYTVG